VGTIFDIYVLLRFPPEILESQIIQKSSVVSNKTKEYKQDSQKSVKPEGGESKQDSQNQLRPREGNLNRIAKIS
jgi:hypothetical protein